MNAAEMKNFFELIGEFGYNVNDVARKLRVSPFEMTVMTVEDYFVRFSKGGLRHKFFEQIAAACLAWNKEQCRLQFEMMKAAA